MSGPESAPESAADQASVSGTDSASEPARAPGAAPASGPASDWPNREMAAWAITELLEEMRGILERTRGRATGAIDSPGGEETEILDFLSRTGEWVDVMDLPGAGLSGRNIHRNRILRMAREGYMEVRRDQRYPNMMSARLAPMGMEARRRRAVREAMELLNGKSASLFRDVTEARRALARVAKRIA